MKSNYMKVVDILATGESWPFLYMNNFQRFFISHALGKWPAVYFNPNDFNNVTEKVNNSQKTTPLSFFELCKADTFAKIFLYVEVP